MTVVDTISTDQARALTDRIKSGVEAIWELIKEAYTSRAWSALGYGSWDEYCTREFGTSRIRLPREDRQEVVTSLRAAGLSVRAIASATGANKETIGKDIRQVSGNRTPEPDDDHELTQEECEELDRQLRQFDSDAAKRVTGTDGKTYPARPTKVTHTSREETKEEQYVDTGTGEIVDAPEPEPVKRREQKPRTNVVAEVARVIDHVQDAAFAADKVTKAHLVNRKEEAATWGRNLSQSMQSLQRLLDDLQEVSQ